MVVAGQFEQVMTGIVVMLYDPTSGLHAVRRVVLFSTVRTNDRKLRGSHQPVYRCL